MRCSYSPGLELLPWKQSHGNLSICVSNYHAVVISAIYELRHSAFQHEKTLVTFWNAYTMSERSSGSIFAFHNEKTNTLYLIWSWWRVDDELYLSSSKTGFTSTGKEPCHHSHAGLFYCTHWHTPHLFLLPWVRNISDWCEQGQLRSSSCVREWNADSPKTGTAQKETESPSGRNRAI